jgi:putative methyltransferase (TIGR04325 family)
MVPPVFIRLARQLRADGAARPEWEYVPDGWVYAERHPEVRGWNVQDVLETYKRKWPQFARMATGTGPLGVAHESGLATNEDILSHNAIMAFGYALALAARDKKRLSLLDWGGGIGHYYLLARTLLPDLEIEYHCKDVPVLSEYGARLFPDQRFSSDERCLEDVYDFVLASTSVHYTEDWRSLLERLAGATRDYLYIAQLPTVPEAPSFVFVQRPYHYGYNTEYLGWCLNQTEFLQAAERSGLRLQREFVYGYQPLIHGAPEQNAYRGYLFRAHPEGRT